jgi:hypothetical protein
MQIHRQKRARVKDPLETYAPGSVRTARTALGKRHHAGETKEDVTFFLQCCKRYKIFVHINGTFYDELDNSVPANHLKSLLRREYLEAGFPLQGKALDLLIGFFLKNCILGADLVHRERVALSEIASKIEQESEVTTHSLDHQPQLDLQGGQIP